MVMGSLYFGNMYDKAFREKIDGMDQHTGEGDMQAIQEQEKNGQVRDAELAVSGCMGMAVGKCGSARGRPGNGGCLQKTAV